MSDEFHSALASGDIPASAKLVLLVLGHLSEGGEGIDDYVSAQDVAAATGLSDASAAVHLRTWSKDYPGLVERKAYLDENERKVVRYRAQF